jgi:hypothetical protein
MRSEKIAQKRWAYTLYRLENGEVVLSVLCGGAAMYELNIPLDDETAAKAIVDQQFLEECADNIRSHPDRYAAKSIRM